MLARVEGKAFIEHPFTRFVLAGAVVFLAIVVITLCFEGPRPEGAPHARDREQHHEDLCGARPMNAPPTNEADFFWLALLILFAFLLLVAVYG